jgi:hypothetical protein
MRRIAELVRYDEDEPGAIVDGGLRVEQCADAVESVVLTARRVSILVDASELIEAVAHVMGWPMLPKEPPDADS